MARKKGEVREKYGSCRTCTSIDKPFFAVPGFLKFAGLANLCLQCSHLYSLYLFTILIHYADRLPYLVCGQAASFLRGGRMVI